MIEQSTEPRLKRLEKLVYALYTVLALLILVFAIGLFLQNYTNKLRALQETLSVSWTTAGGLSFDGWDGPFVITHVVNDNKTMIASLPVAVAHVESGRTEITPEQMAKLIWRDRKTGELMSPPKPGTPLRVLYYVARSIQTNPT